jgi:hypothetical protein
MFAMIFSFPACLYVSITSVFRGEGHITSQFGKGPKLKLNHKYSEYEEGNLAPFPFGYLDICWLKPSYVANRNYEETF